MTANIRTCSKRYQNAGTFFALEIVFLMVLDEANGPLSKYWWVNAARRLTSLRKSKFYVYTTEY